MTKTRPDQPGRCPSIDPHDTLQCTRAIHDDDQCQAGGIAWRKGSPRIEWDRERADRLQEDVERMQKDVERLTAEREWFKDRFPCDGACVDAPEEACSRHGRNPADLWRIIREVAAERDALAAQVDRVEKLAEWFDSVQAEHLSQDDCQCEMKDCYECGPWHACTHNGPLGRARQIRDALAGSEADTGAEEAGHRCEPYYSRSECGQCGWQEQWCATCSRQMCGCATGATDQDAMGADQ